MTVQKPPKKHHFVPRSLLRRFSVGGAGDQIWVFDKASGRAFTTSLMNAASQNDFNTLQTSAGALNFEKVFDETDGELAGLFGTLAERRSVTGLDEDFRRRLADVLTIQLLRTPLARSTLQNVPRDLVASIAAAGLSDDPDATSLPNDNDARAATLAMMGDTHSWRAGLMAKDLVLLEPSGAARFWISDHPIVRFNPAPNGETGLQSRGVEIYLPLGADLMLGLLCSSVRHKLNERQIELLDLDPDRAQRLIDLREGLRTGAPVRRDDDVVAAFNGLQVSNSARFIYASRDDFAAARQVLEQAPQLRSVESLIRVGRLGEGPPPARNMPTGQCLVLYGRRSWHLVPIEAWDPDAPLIQATAQRPEVLALAMEDAPFEVAEFYVDGQARRIMRGVRVDITSSEPPLRFTVRFTDPALDAFDQTISSTSSARRRQTSGA